ncbi:hypothetical protein EDB89DRAFT_2223127 [Lactarius sanguifluus]|nr:hypothetical protein EDB89DRAFT_2223127 [Lactarius sanguifluus]
MDNEHGDDYLRTVASFIRTNESRLAEAAFQRRCPTRHAPINYVDVSHSGDSSDSMSLSSIRTSLSVVSRLSLGVGIWTRPEPPSVDQELKYIPALSLRAPGPTKIMEIAADPPNENALPLDSFRNLQSLECLDIDPRTLLGWDRLSESLWSLTIKRSGLDDVSDLFINTVIDDSARRQAAPPLDPPNLSRQSSFHSTAYHHPKWAFLRHLSLADNALTLFRLKSSHISLRLTHLDLSSNLLYNMIDSVLGIYKKLGQRLVALERVGRQTQSSGGIGRGGPTLSCYPTLPRCGWRANAFTEIESDYPLVPVGGAATATTAPPPPPPAPAPSTTAVAPAHRAAPALRSSPAFSPAPSSHQQSPLPPRHSAKPRKKRAKAHRAPGRRPGERERCWHVGHGLGGAKRARRLSPFGVALSARRAGVVTPRTRGDGSSRTLLPAEEDSTTPKAPTPKHRRSHTEYAPALALADSDGPPSPVLVRPPPDRTMSVRVSARRSAARRARVAASVFEAPGKVEDGVGEEIKEADAFRARVEALRSEMGDGWLKVFSQSHAGGSG